MVVYKRKPMKKGKKPMKKKMPRKKAVRRY